MSSYLTDAQKLSLGNEFFNLHDTWKREIRMFKTAQQVVIVTNPDNNVFFPDAPFADQVQNIIVSGCYNARIQYNPKQDLSFLATNSRGSDDQEALKASDGIVRIKVDYSGSAFLRDTKRVTFDENEFEVFTDPKPHGLFVPNFYTYYLKRVN